MRMMVALLLCLCSSISVAEQIKPFTTDGCSVFPDGTLEQEKLWLSCCRLHDYAYWKGGTSKERLIADQQLKQCVLELDETFVANLMLIGVRVGGTPYLPTPFRWGYGWEFMRGYQPLSDAEKQQVISQGVLLSSPFL